MLPRIRSLESATLLSFSSGFRNSSRKAAEQKRRDLDFFEKRVSQWRFVDWSYSSLP